MVRSTEIPKFKTFNELRLTRLESPGLARVLLIGGLLGESDWNLGNFGRAPLEGGGTAPVRRIDFGMSFNFQLLPVDKLTSLADLLSMTGQSQFNAEHVSQQEFEKTLAMLRASGESLIRNAGDPFEAVLDEYRDLPRAAAEIGQHGHFVDQIVDRLNELLALTSQTQS